MASNRPQKTINQLHEANQAEILRAHQRDDEFVKSLADKVRELSYQLRSFKWIKSLLMTLDASTSLRLVYFAFTSALGNQTLGEEYTGIVQANLIARKIPSLAARIFAAFLEIFGEHGLKIILVRLRRSVNNLNSQWRPETVSFINLLLDNVKTAIPLIILFHKALFYLYGHYYSLGRRLANIDYAKIYGKRPTDTVSWGLKLLGIATIIQCAARLIQREPNCLAKNDAISVPEQDGMKCLLCQESSPTTLTPCGHLFCWNCLANWLRIQPQCPYCLERVMPSRIVYLMNI